MKVWFYTKFDSKLKQRFIPNAIFLKFDNDSGEFLS